MEVKEIKYIGFYNFPNSRIKRAAALSANNKMDYICDSINKAGYKVHVISPSWFNDISNNAKYCTSSTIEFGENKKVTLAPSFGTKKRFTGYIKIVFSLLWLFFWLIFYVKRNEKILVYHAPWLALPVLMAKKIKGFYIVLEVEEIYHKVWTIKRILKKWNRN